MKLACIGLFVSCFFNVLSQENNKIGCDSLTGLYDGKKFSLSYRNGFFLLSIAEKSVKLKSAQDFTGCLDFNFRGIYINRFKNNWYQSNHIVTSGILLFNCLDDLGRSMMFSINLKDDQYRIIGIGKSKGDFLPSRFNRYYFDEKTMTVAICGDDLSDNQKVLTNIYFSKIDSNGITFLKKIRLPNIDHFTVIGSGSLF